MNIKIIIIGLVLLSRVVTVVESGKTGRQGRSRGPGRSDVLVGGNEQSPRAQVDLQHQYHDGLQAALEAEVLKRQNDVELTRVDSAEGHLGELGAQRGHPRQLDGKKLAHPRQDDVKLNHDALKDQLHNLQVLLEETRRQAHQSRKVSNEMGHLHQKCAEVIPEVGELLQEEHGKTEELRSQADDKARELNAFLENHRNLKREHGKANAIVTKWNRKTYNLVKARNEVVSKHNTLQEKHEQHVKTHDDLLRSYKKENKKKKALNEKYKKQLRVNNDRIENRDKHRSVNNELVEQVKNLEDELREKHGQYEALQGVHKELRKEHKHVRRMVKEGDKERFKLAESHTQAAHRYNTLVQEHKKERKMHDKLSREHEKLRHHNYVTEVLLDSQQTMLNQKVREEKEYVELLQNLKQRFNENDKGRAEHLMLERKWVQGTAKFMQDASDLNNQLKRYQSLAEERQRALDTLDDTLTNRDEKIESITKEVEDMRVSVADSQQEHSECQHRYQDLYVKYRRAVNFNNFLKSSRH